MRLVLPSNSSLKHFPDNSLSSYTVQPPQPIDFGNARWEVALEEIQFYKSWYNVQNCTIQINDVEPGTQSLIPLKDGHYSNITDLVTEINDQIKLKCSRKIHNTLEFKYDKETARCIVELKGTMKVSINFSPGLDKILGFKVGSFQMKSSSLGSIIKMAEDPHNLNAIFNVMVYTDIVQSTIVGDVEAPLLRSVAVQNEHWTIQTSNFLKLQYLPVSQKRFNTISIYLYTDYGEKVPFTSGRTVVTLNFRQVRPLSFI